MIDLGMLHKQPSQISTIFIYLSDQVDILILPKEISISTRFIFNLNQKNVDWFDKEKDGDSAKH